MVNTLELTSLNGSLLIQIITLFANLFALQTPLQTSDLILKDILGLETVVQITELIFYLWYRFSLIGTLSDVTQFRYYDWFFTTPVMLFTTACYYIYLNYQENQKNEKEPLTLEYILQTYSRPLMGIFVFNALMLLFGYLQEINLLSIAASSLFGYLSLMGSFGILYFQFVKQVPNQAALFYIMFSVWSLYGVAAMLPNIAKNFSYNILDIFAKNFYGVFLSYLILQKSTGQAFTEK